MSILVTGGARLYRLAYLRKAFRTGYDVVVLDNLSNSSPKADWPRRGHYGQEDKILRM